MFQKNATDEGVIAPKALDFQINVKKLYQLLQYWWTEEKISRVKGFICVPYSVLGRFIIFWHDWDSFSKNFAITSFKILRFSAINLPI